MSENTEVVFNSIRGGYSKLSTYRKMLKFARVFNCTIQQEEGKEWFHVFLTDNNIPVAYFKEYQN